MERRPIPGKTIANPFGPQPYLCVRRLGLHTKPGTRAVAGGLTTAPAGRRRLHRMPLAASAIMRAVARPT